MNFRQRLLSLIVDLYPQSRLDFDKGIIARIVRETIDDLNNKFGFELVDEQKVKKIIKTQQFLLYQSRRRMTRAGINITNETITEEEVNNLKIIMQSRLLHFLIENYSNESNVMFYDRFLDFLKSIWVTECEWLKETRYETFFNEYMNIAEEIYNDKAKLEQVKYLSKKETAMFQSISRIQTKTSFFKKSNKIDHKLIDEYTQCFKELCQIYEDYIKFLYLIKEVNNLPRNVEKLNFYTVWKAVREDKKYSVFASPLPNTDLLNAGKHLGLPKDVRTRIVTYESNRNSVPISYQTFANITREMYACCVTLIKIKMMIIMVSGKSSATKKNSTNSSTGP